MPAPANLVHETSTTTGTGRPIVSHKRLLELLQYNPETGHFTWRVTYGRGSRRPIAGNRAGTRHNAGYWQLTIDARHYLGHRLAWVYMTGEWPDSEVDHRDTDRSNNKWSNLRKATHAQNQSNVKRQKNNKSGYKGVSFSRHTRKWLAQITINSKQTYLGIYSTPAEAHAAYCEAACKHKREFARLA